MTINATYVRVQLRLIQLSNIAVDMAHVKHTALQHHVGMQNANVTLVGLEINAKFKKVSSQLKLHFIT